MLVYFGLYIYKSRNVNHLDMGKLVFRCVWDAETAGSSPAIQTKIIEQYRSGLSSGIWNAEHAGSNPAYSTVRLLLIHRPCATERRIRLLSYSVIGNTSGFEPEESKFEPWWDN